MTTEEGNIDHSFDIIHRFFELYSLSDALLLLESSLLAATSNRIWTVRAPGDLLHFINNLEVLCENAFAVSNLTVNPAEVQTTKPEDGVPNIYATWCYVNKYYHSNEWNNFPRSLTASQFYNPHEAISDFCNYMSDRDWKKFIKLMMDYALSNDAFYDGGHEHNILQIRLRLLQLIEAAHLIDVRMHRRQENAG